MALVKVDFFSQSLMRNVSFQAILPVDKIVKGKKQNEQKKYKTLYLLHGIFGNDLEKEFPKEGYEYMEYNAETNKYYAVGTGLDNQEDVFLLDKIEKKESGYTVQIVEFLEDYSETYNTEQTEYNIQIKNLNDEIIGTVKSTENETNIQQLVKDNIDKSTKKEVELKTDSNGNIYVTNVKKVE